VKHEIANLCKLVVGIGINMYLCKYMFTLNFCPYVLASCLEPFSIVWALHASFSSGRFSNEAPTQSRDAAAEAIMGVAILVECF
jgi:hypothetical protein